MAKKKTAIGDLIKSDMSRRVIGEGTSGEGTEISEKAISVSTEPANADPVHNEGPAKSSAEKRPLAASAALPLFADQDTLPKRSAGFAELIAGQARSAGLTDEADLRGFYDFLQSQAMRYIRGFNAGRRFHG